ncbi:hypothetical protein QEN19_001444 [Hanseniaspora menglaensis]
MSEEFKPEETLVDTERIAEVSVNESLPVQDEPVIQEQSINDSENNLTTEKTSVSVVENADEPMSVEENEKHAEETPEPEREQLTEPTLHISGLPVTVKATELAPILESFGELTKIVILPPKTIHQAFGFVSFSNKEDAERCIEGLNDKKYEFDNQYTWRVNWAKQGPLKNRNVGPSGRPYTLTDRKNTRRGGHRGGRGGFRGGRGGARRGYAPY